MLGKVGSSLCAIMPERLARTDPFTQVTEMVGSGPFRFKADERMVGSRVVYEKFDGYVPREGEAPQWTSGPKRVALDRVEWHPIPDLATAAAAMQSREMDWWEAVSADVMPLLTRMRSQVADPTGYIGTLRMNTLQPPFDNPAIRRVLLQVVDQVDYMQAVTGDDPKLRHTPTGFFCPGLPMATEAGLEVLTRPRDFTAAKKALAEAGYKGEKVVLMGASDLPNLKALGDVSADLLARAGFNVEYQVLDWGTVVQRRTRKEPVSQGGWSVFGTFWAGLDQATPAAHAFLRSPGESGSFGWPKSEALEALRQQWLDAPDLAAQRALASQIQQQALTDVPYVPLGQYFVATAFQSNVNGVLDGPPLFWNVTKG
jgi:peptide/nickel transport system substrate-binding protein